MYLCLHQVCTPITDSALLIYYLTSVTKALFNGTGNARNGTVSVGLYSIMYMEIQEKQFKLLCPTCCKSGGELA